MPLIANFNMKILSDQFHLLFVDFYKIDDLNDGSNAP